MRQDEMDTDSGQRILITLTRPQAIEVIDALEDGGARDEITRSLKISDDLDWEMTMDAMWGE